MATRPGPIPLTAAAVAAVLLAAISLVGGPTIRGAIGAGTSSYSDPITTIGDLATGGDAGTTRIPVGADGSVLTSLGGRAQWAAGGASTPTTTRGDLIVRGASADQRLAIGASGRVLTSDGTDPTWSAPAAVSAVSALPESSSVSLWLRNADLRGAVGSTLGVWPAFTGPDAYGFVSGAPPYAATQWVGASSGRTIYQSTGGVMEFRLQASSGGGWAPIIPGDGTDRWTVCIVVANAVLTGTAAALLGWGQNTSDRNVALFSRFNSVSQWRLSIRSFSQTDTTNSITSASYPSTTDATALLASFDGTTISLWKAVAADSAWVLIGTLTHSLDIIEEHPLMLGRTGTGTASLSSGLGIREVLAWKSALGSDARTSLRSYLTTAGLL